MIKEEIIKESDSLHFNKQKHNLDKVSNKKKTKINKNKIGNNLNTIEDKAQDCNAYLKIKHFLAKQVLEIETKIEEKDSFIMGATIKINKLTYIIENFRNKFCLLNKRVKRLREKNRKLKSLLKPSNRPSDKSFASDNESKLDSKDICYSEDISSNLSLNNDAFSCYSFEKLGKNEDNIHYSGNLNIIENETNKKNEEIKMKTAKYLRELKKLQNRIKNDELNFQMRNELLDKENLKITKRNFLLNAELNKKNSKINSLENKNIFILNELVELIYSLRTMDIRNLNKIYLENLTIKKKEDLEILNVPSCLGIKYNILSAESFLSYLINTDRNRSKENENVFYSLKDNFPNSYKHLNYNNNQNGGKNQNLLYKRKCNIDNEATNKMDNENLFRKSFLNSQKENRIKKLNMEKDNFESKLNKSFLEEIATFNAKGKKSYNDDKSLYKSLFDIDDSDSNSICNDSSLENYLEANYLQDKNPLFVYELPKEIIQDNHYINDLIENQNKITSKIMNISKYEDQLNYLLERNLKKTKLLSFSDSE